MFPQVTIIILNWNGWKDTVECLESLSLINYSNYYIILIDNDSADDSIAQIKNYAEGRMKVKSPFFTNTGNTIPIPYIEYSRPDIERLLMLSDDFLKMFSEKKMVLIKNEKNYGFAEGNNIGIRFALKFFNPQYFLLLNNDMVVKPDFLSELVRIGEQNQKFGILGPTICYYNYKGLTNIVNFAGGKIYKFFPHHIHLGFNEQFDVETWPQDHNIVDFIQGACMLIKNDVIKICGMLPTDYFMQYEDLDFSITASRNGFLNVYVPKSLIWHKISASYSKMTEYKFEKSFENGIYFYHKNFSFLKFLVFLLMIILIKLPIYSIYFSIQTKNFKVFSSSIKGTIYGIQKSFS